MATTLSDVEVTIDVVKPVVPENLGTLAIFMPASAQSYKSYAALEDLTADITDAQVTAIATQYFAQEGHGENLAVIGYTDVAEAANEYADKGWEFATVAAAGKAASPASADGTVVGKSETSGATTTGSEDLLALSNWVEGQNQGFAVIGLPATSKTVEAAEATNQYYAGNTRTIIFVSGADETAAAGGIGALVGALANRTVGSITWKFRSLGGVSPVDLTASQIATLHQNGMFTYVTKAGVAQTSEGVTASGEFIDALHGDDWIKTNIEASLQTLLNNTDKLTYDTAGINSIEAAVTAVLMTATSNTIISTNVDTGNGDYTVTTVSRANSDAADIAARKYNGLSFTYVRSGAIHSIKVHGTVTL